MAVIYLRHPRHGTKVACGESEAQGDEARGWERFTYDVPAPVVPLGTPGAATGADSSIPAFLQTTETKKPGVPGSDVCLKCEGCGQVADSDDQEPWSVWEALPEQSKLGISLGLVRPIPCPECTPLKKKPGRKPKE